MLTLSTASDSASIWARRFFGFLPQRIDSCDAQYIAVQLARQFVVLEHDIQRLIPRDVIEHDRQIAVDLGSSTTFKPLISWIRRKKSFRSTSLRLTEIGSPVYLASARRRLLLRQLDFLLGSQIHGRLNRPAATGSLPEGGIGVGGNQFRRCLIGKTIRRFLRFCSRLATLSSDLPSLTEYLGSTKAKSSRLRGVARSWPEWMQSGLSES